jgi:hypothetical protein
MSTRNLLYGAAACVLGIAVFVFPFAGFLLAVGTLLWLAIKMS